MSFCENKDVNQSELWLLILGMPILVATLSFFALRSAPFRHPRKLAATAFGNIFPSAEAPSASDPSAPPLPARRPEQAAAAEIDRQEAALLICRELGNRQAEGEVLGRLGLAFAALGATSQAVEAYRERLELAQETGDRKSEAGTLDNLSLAYAELGEMVRAQECHEAAQRIYQALGDPRAERNSAPSSPLPQKPADRRQARHGLESPA